MHHHPQNQERALNLSILIVSGPGNKPGHLLLSDTGLVGLLFRAEAALQRLLTPGGALPSISLSFSLATILPPEPKDFDFSKSPSSPAHLMKGMRFPRRKDPVGPVHAVRRTGQPGPRFNYELFNCNNFNIRYWSWNYRGCWPIIIFQAFAPYNLHMMGVPIAGMLSHGLALQLFLVKGFKLYSFQLQDPKEPCI
ncbi:hypothetical protein LSUE1_G006146, partial [Lachnellula suecica]